jgi:hypothetical protein
MCQAQVCGFFIIIILAKEVKKCFQTLFFQKKIKIKRDDAFSICQVFNH